MQADALVFFGATGDLAYKKVFPALQEMVQTYAAVRLHIDNARWRGVPFYIRAGKCLPVTCTEVRVQLKAEARTALGERESGRSNYLRFRLGPDVAIALGVRSKLPGDALTGHEVELLAAQGRGDEMDAYARLLHDAMHGDAMLFARQDTVEQEWRIVDPILGTALTDTAPALRGGATLAVHAYQTGTWGPAEAERLTAAAGGCVAPGAS